MIMYEPTQPFSLTVRNVSTQRLFFWWWCIRWISKIHNLRKI